MRSCVDELREDPRAAHIWSAISFAVGAPAPRRPYGSAVDPCQGQLRSFWDTFGEHFTWDFLPADFLHDLYEHWMDTRFPEQSQLTRDTFTRRLKGIATASGEWVYTRSRPGSLMDAPEPLTELLPRWSHCGSDAAMRGLRRSNTVHVSSARANLRPAGCAAA